MDTAHKTEEEKLEFFDSPDELSIKVDKFISLLKKSTHFIAFTGAGVSTSAGVPDFRSGYNTVLPTGPGAWEKKALKQQVKKKIVSVGMHEAIPTKTHMSLVELERKGLLKYLVSQNVDGLHRRSGFLPEKLAELHGNTNLEFCKKCGKQYLRDFRCRNSQNSVHDHKTIRKCDNSSCKGDLYDSIVNFGENLPEREINESFEHAEKADLCLAMGSSLRVTPAANIPQIVGKKNDLVIVNIQKTPLDKYASLRIYSMCDQFMELVMKKLEFEIPEFTLTRRISVKIDKNERILFKGIDIDGCPYSIFKSIEIEKGKKMVDEPFELNLKDFGNQDVVKAILEFQGHYKEPKLKIEILMKNLMEGKEIIFIMEYSPKINKWINCFEKENKK